jgi:hypothetical protein
MSDITLTPRDVLGVKQAHYCVSCGELLLLGDHIGVCQHGLLCEICRYDSHCPECKAKDDADDALAQWGDTEE